MNSLRASRPKQCLGGLFLCFAFAFAREVGGQCLSQQIAWWSGDGTAEDVTGPHEGTLKNGAVFGPGRSGLAFQLDGVDDYVEVSDAPGLNFDGKVQSFTVAAWIFRRSGGTPHVIYDKSTPGPPFIGYRLAIVGDHVILRTDDFRNLAFNCGEGKGAVVSPNTWHHVAGVFSPGLSRVYLDGILQTSCNYPGAGQFQNNVKPWIGAFTSATGGFFNGVLDDVRIFGTALSDTDVKALAKPCA